MTDILAVYSMTAYARQQQKIDEAEVQGQYTWEIRSVNQRYLEINIRLQDDLRYLETAIRDALKSQLSRGKIDISLSLELQQNQSNLAVNSDTLSQLGNAINEVQNQFIEATQLNPLEILQWPGVLATENPSLNDSLEQKILQSLHHTISELKSHRQREGQALAKVILERCNQIESELRQVEPLIPEIRQQHLQKLREKVNALGESLDEQRLYQEAAILAQKIDIDEEIKRLHTHLQEVRHVLKSGQPIGRRLDFLMQELNREANTLGSKSINSRTSQTSVELKVLIEQMREQVQNIE